MLRINRERVTQMIARVSAEKNFKEKLSQACLNALIKKQTNQENLRSTADLFRDLFSAIKNTAREAFYTPILNDLENNKISALRALLQILKIYVGSQGEHSFKYYLLINLFGRKERDLLYIAFIEEDDAITANEMIDLFIEVLSELTEINEKFTLKTTNQLLSVCEDKNKLLQLKINALISAVKAVIEKFHAECSEYDQKMNGSRIESLRLEIVKQKGIAKNATKFSHNEISYSTEYTDLFCPQCYSNGFCEHGVYGMTYKNAKIEKPVYIPDTEKRNQATEQYKRLEEELFLSKPDPSKPFSYKKWVALKKQLSNLYALKNDLEINLVNKSELKFIPIHFDRYKKILNEIIVLTSREDIFINYHFMPRSEYSQLSVASSLVRQSIRNNSIFSKLPAQINEAIVLNTINHGSHHPSIVFERPQPAPELVEDVWGVIGNFLKPTQESLQELDRLIDSKNLDLLNEHQKVLALEAKHALITLSRFAECSHMFYKTMQFKLNRLGETLQFQCETIQHYIGSGNMGIVKKEVLKRYYKNKELLAQLLTKSLTVKPYMIDEPWCNKSLTLMQLAYIKQDMEMSLALREAFNQLPNGVELMQAQLEQFNKDGDIENFFHKAATVRYSDTY